MNRDQIEQLHNSGLMPDWAYYQQVQKPWYVSLQEQWNKAHQELEARKAAKIEQAEIDARAKELAIQYLQEQVPVFQKEMGKMIDQVLDGLNK